MREEFFRHLWTLIRLRYQLIWARMRTSNGRIVLFFALYLVGASFVLFSAAGGLGTAVLANEFSKVEDRVILARWALTTFFVNGMGLSLMFGLGTQDAFSDESLRRYPLKAKERFIIRQIIGLLDPVWAFLAAGAFGLAAGFWLFGKGKIIPGALAAALFITASYLATICLLSFVGRVMRSRAVSSTLGIIVLALLSFGPLAFSLLISSGADAVLKQIGRLLSFTPSGAAAAMMAEDNWGRVLGGAALLVVWVVALALFLKMIEGLRLGAEAHSSSGISDGFWDSFYDRIAGIFGRQYAPLVSKSLRYHLRCNLIRFSLLTSPLLVLFGKLLVPGGGPLSESIVTLGLFFIIGGFTGVSMNLNIFGYDGAGVRRYAVLPSTFATGLRAGSLASLLVRAVAMLAAVAVWIIVTRKQFDPGMLPLILEFAVTGLFLFNAFGLWTSVLSPKAADFNAIWNNRLSFGANVAMFCGGVVFGITMTLSNFIDSSELLRFWPLGLAPPVLSLAFYLFSMKMIEPVLNRNREKLINQIAGARDN